MMSSKFDGTTGRLRGKLVACLVTLARVQVISWAMFLNRSRSCLNKSLKSWREMYAGPNSLSCGNWQERTDAISCRRVQVSIETLKGMVQAVSPVIVRV